MLKQRLQRGDTLIEVLFAVSVFSFVVVGALAIMNQGTAASQRALEITLVREQIDAQAETLRFMHDSYVAVYQSGLTFNLTDGVTTPAEEWSRILPKTVSSASDFAVIASCPTPSSNSFIVDPRNALFVTSATALQPATGFSQVEYNSSGVFTAARGLWVEAVRSTQSTDADQSNTGFIDFHIRACWESAGLSVPMSLGTIVRLYEPRG